MLWEHHLNKKDERWESGRMEEICPANTDQRKAYEAMLITRRS